MPSSREAAHRHAQHFAEVLEATAELYQAGGESVLSGLKSFDTERANIERGREWAAANYESDDAALRLASAYPEAGIACLELRLPPRQRIHWLEVALATARRLGQREAEGIHLGNLGIAYATLGDSQHAIEFYNQQLQIARESSI